MAGRRLSPERPNPKALIRRYATSPDKVPVTEVACQKLPKLIPLGF